MIHPSKEVMEMAIKLAKEKHKEGGHAVAAIIVKGDEIIAKEFTTLVRDKDPTGHAEINAIKAAAKKLNSLFLEDCYLYTTFEPCPMCASAAIWAKIKGIVYGAAMEDRNEKYTQRIDLPCRKVIGRGTPKLEIYPEFMRKECQELLKL